MVANGPRTLATKIASLFLPVRINGDVAALKGIMKEMVEADERAGGTVLDHAFIQQYTHGFDEFLGHGVTLGVRRVLATEHRA